MSDLKAKKLHQKRFQQPATEFVSSSRMWIEPQSIVTSKLFDFIVCNTWHTAGEHMYVNWRVKSTMFRWIFSVSWTALRSNWMYLSNDLIFDLGLLRYSWFMRHAILLAKSGFIMRLTRSRMSRSRLAPLVQWTAKSLRLISKVILSWRFKLEFCWEYV